MFPFVIHINLYRFSWEMNEIIYLLTIYINGNNIIPTKCLLIRKQYNNSILVIEKFKMIIQNVTLIFVIKKYFETKM